MVQHLKVQPRIAFELGWRVRDAGLDGRQRLGEARRIACEERLAEFRLARKMVVQGRFGDLQLGGDVGVAEAVEPADLDQSLGDIEDPRCGIGIAALTCGHDRCLSFRRAPLDA